MRLFLAAALASLIIPVAAHAVSLEDAIAADSRDPANAARDQYRHPREMLEFFGLEPDMTVVEVWPSTGWWTEILAPYLRADGIYIAAGYVTSGEDASGYRTRVQQAFVDKLAANPSLYDKTTVTELGVPGHTKIAPAGSADLVLTFRNVHNWLAAGTAEEMFRAFHDVLEPGGVLGVAEHRAPEGTDVETMKKSGYMTEAYVIELAEKAGFTLDAKSELNANPADTADHPAGVWTLPPTFRVCRDMAEGGDRDACFARYRAIGESDRMTLRFRKPGG